MSCFTILPGMSACSLCARSLILALTSSKTPYIEPVVSNDIATSSWPPGGNGAAAVTGSLSVVLLLDRTLGVLDNFFFNDSAFFRDSFETRDVSPTLDPDFKGTTVVTVPLSTTTLEALFVRETFADDLFDNILVKLSLDLASFSSTVNVEAFLNNGGVGDSISLLPSEGDDPDIASSFVVFFIPTDGIFGSDVGLLDERLASLLGASSGEANDLDFLLPNIFLPISHNRMVYQ